MSRIGIFVLTCPGMSQPFFLFFPHYFFNSDEEFQGVYVMWGQTSGYNLECSNILFYFIALGRQHTNLTTHTQTHNMVTTTPLDLADASLTRWTVIDGGMYHPPSHCLWHTTLMKYAGAQKYSHSVRDTSPYIESHILQGNKRRYFIHQYSSQLPQIWYVNIRIYLIWKMQNTSCAE